MFIRCLSFSYLLLEDVFSIEEFFFVAGCRVRFEFFPDATELVEGEPFRMLVAYFRSSGMVDDIL